jgi:hypothetical protein
LRARRCYDVAEFAIEGFGDSFGKSKNSKRRACSLGVADLPDSPVNNLSAINRDRC